MVITEFVLVDLCIQVQYTRTQETDLISVWLKFKLNPQNKMIWNFYEKFAIATRCTRESNELINEKVLVRPTSTKVV